MPPFTAISLHPLTETWVLLPAFHSSPLFCSSWTHFGPISATSPLMSSLHPCPGPESLLCTAAGVIFLLCKSAQRDPLFKFL